MSKMEEEKKGSKEVPEGKVSIKCPVCGKVWNKKVAYCPECGADLRQKSNF